MKKAITASTVITITAITYYIKNNPPSYKILIPPAIILAAIILNITPRLLKNRPMRKTKVSVIINDNVIEQISKILLWMSFFSLIVVLYPGIFDYTVYGKITLQRLIISATAFITVYITSKTISNHIIQTERKDKTITVKMRIAHYTIVFTAFLSVLKYLGLSTAFTNLLLAGSITSIIIGLAAQKTIGNFIAGVILLMDKPFKIGDFIEVQGVKGFVTDIQFMSTIIQTYDEKTVRIPNEVVLTERVTNYKKNKIIRITQTVGISYDSDIEKAKKAILEALDEEELVLAYPEPFIGVEEYGDSSINITLWFYVPFDEWYTVSRRVLENIKKKFDEYGVEIPYPQLVVHGGTPIKIDNAFIPQNKK